MNRFNQTIANYLGNQALFIIFCVGLTISLASCCGHKEEPSTAEKVALYYLKDASTVEEKGHIDAYFDFSDGMNWAYANDTTKGLLKNIVNKVISEKDVEVFSLASDSIKELPKKSTELYNSIMDSASYTQQYAPIEKTLQRIIERNNSALMVTDFEEYTADGRIQQAAFASKYFTEWLERGHDITFYVTNYNEPSQSGPKAKHLYYIVFSKRDHSLLTKIQDALNGGGKNYQEYLLSLNPCTLTTEYPGAAYGGCYHDDSGRDIVSTTIEDGSLEGYCNFHLEGHAATIFANSRYFKEVPQMNAEYYPMSASWQDIVKNASSLSPEAVKGSGVLPFTHLFRNLFVDLSNVDSYKVGKLDVIATDVQDDLDLFVNNLIALSKKPDMVDDGQGGKIADLKDGSDQYYNEKGEMLPEFIYKEQPTGQIMDVFELDQLLFDNTKAKDPKKVEIGIKFKDGFSGTIAGYNPGDMIRLDVIMKECEPNIQRVEELFTWQGNTNLADAIKNTLQNMKPEKRVVYTYFIKTI